MSTTNSAIHDLIHELEGYENTIWAYKFEYHDLDSEKRAATISKLQQKIDLTKAKINALTIKDKLKNL